MVTFTLLQSAWEFAKSHGTRAMHDSVERSHVSAFKTACHFSILACQRVKKRAKFSKSSLTIY